MQLSNATGGQGDATQQTTDMDEPNASRAGSYSWLRVVVPGKTSVEVVLSGRALWSLHLYYGSLLSHGQGWRVLC